MSRKEWIHEEVTSEGVRFTVRQQKTDLLKLTVKCLLATIAIFYFSYLLIDFDTAWALLGLLIFFVCSIVLLGLIPSIIFLAIPISISRKPRSTFKISEKEIIFEEKPHRGNPDKIQLKDISSVSCSGPNGNSSHVTVNVTVGQPTLYSMANDAGNSTSSLVKEFASSFYEMSGYRVEINHKGKYLDLACGLSKSEAEYLYERVKDLII